MYDKKQLNNIKKNYSNYGVALLKNFCSNKNLSLVKKAVDFCVNNPSPFSSKINSSGGVFFHDYWTYKRNKYIKQLLSDPNLINTIKKIVSTKNLKFFHDHTLIKNPKSPSTPWHHDRPYYFLKGPKVFSVWITPDKVDEDNSLAFCINSHKSKYDYLPVHFDDKSNLLSHPSLKILDEESLSKESKNGIIVFKMQPGDAVIFHNKTLHRSLPSSENKKRSALSLRLVGDDTRLTKICVNNPQPPFHKFGMKLRENGKLDENWFPTLPFKT